MKEVKKEVPEALVLIVGRETDYVRSLLHDAGAAGLENNFACTGWLSGSELAAAYGMSDIVVVPSLYLDPFPTVNLEAGATGKPVVGTCFGGTPEVVQDGVSGYIVNPLDTKKFAEKIMALLRDETLANKLGAAAQMRIMKEFSEETHVQKLTALYEKLLPS